MGSAGLKVNEPSMEEILASIRRIIADDEALQPSEPEEPVSSPLKSVLEITELHVAPLAASGPNEPVLGPWSRGEALPDEPPSAGEAAERFNPLQEPEPQAPTSFPMPGPSAMAKAPVEAVQQAKADLLLSDAASASVSGAFERLSASVKPSQPQTVEDLMKEMLRPMLKTWLDDNLPAVVERLVRAEIERVTRCRG